MLFGDKKKFAIECEIIEHVDDWVFGHILFWFCGNKIGNGEDLTDIRGCCNWLKKFANEVINRFENSLDGLNNETVFKLLYNSVIFNKNNKLKYKPKFYDIFSRFHISHIGMSSFDRFDILLIEKPKYYQRCLWRVSNDNKIRECYLPEGEMQKIATLCYKWLENKLNYNV